MHPVTNEFDGHFAAPCALNEFANRAWFTVVDGWHGIEEMRGGLRHPIKPDLGRVLNGCV